MASSGPSLLERLEQPSPDWVPGRRLREGEGVASGEKLPGPERLTPVSQLVADDLSEKTVLWRLISLKEGTDL